MTHGEALTRPFAALEKYAGWLAKDHVSNAVRAGVQALGTAMDVGSDTSALMLTLASDIRRLPSGDVRKMLRKSFGEVGAALSTIEQTRHAPDA